MSPVSIYVLYVLQSKATIFKYRHRVNAGLINASSYSHPSSLFLWLVKKVVQNQNLQGNFIIFNISLVWGLWLGIFVQYFSWCSDVFS